MGRMSAVLIDTHVLAWSLIDPGSLAPAALSALEAASTILVPPCALHEITREGQKWKMGHRCARMPTSSIACVLAQGFDFSPYTARMAMASGSLDWVHRDPFDRMIAATALELSCPLISKDAVFDALHTLPGWKGRIWAEDI